MRCSRFGSITAATLTSTVNVFGIRSWIWVEQSSTLKAKLIPLHQTYWAHSLKELNLQVHKSPGDDNKNTFLCLDFLMYLSLQWMITECSGTTMITFCLQAFSIRNLPGRCCTDHAFCCCCWLDHLRRTQGVIFFPSSYALCSLSCLHPQRCRADAHDHQGDRPHGNLSCSQMRVAPWASSPPVLSGGDALITEWLCAGVEGPLQLLGLFVQWW